MTFPAFDHPEASIVIPVHSGADFTERCLRSILHSIDAVAYEVILVDDAADADTKALLASLDGVRVIVNATNENFLRSSNRGAAAARGDSIVLLNNDTEPQAGWLDNMLRTLAARPDAGILAAKLIYPDLVLQEAGGIIWRDGSAWNFGRGADGDMPEYNYTRPVDYGSAAALLVRRQVWEAVGGFDERFAPAYWEDVDLCFEARAAGWEVLYEPGAIVIHHEGRSQGTDTSSGGKRHQAINQRVFAEKWGAQLERQPVDPGPENAYRASDWRRHPTVFIADHQIPQPDRDAGSLRMQHIIDNLLAMNCRVVFLPDNHATPEPYTSRLLRSGVELLAGGAALEERLAALAGDLPLAILSRPYVAARYLHLFRRYAPSTTIAYDTVDLHFVREQRAAALESDVPSRLAESFRHIEAGLARAADVTLVVSEEEGRTIEELTGARTVVVPLANAVWADPPGPSGRNGVLFVGGFGHEPNVAAAVRLAERIMPRVWSEMPEAELQIVGGAAPDSITRLASNRVHVLGWVADLDPLLASARVSAAPVDYGAGVKGKVTQALAAGLPVVTTQLGAEGTCAEAGVDLAVADDDDAFAAAIVRLFRDDAAWQRMSAAGQGLIRRTCSPEVQSAALAALVSPVRADDPAPTPR